MGGVRKEAFGILNMESFPAQLFDGFPEPVLLLEGGTVRYRNPAAARLFPGVSVDGAPPPELPCPLEPGRMPSEAAGEFGGRSYTVSFQALCGGVLAVLRPLETRRAGPGLERITVHLRKETAGLAAALQRLDPTEGRVDEAKEKKYLAAANQGLYRLLRLTDHLEFVDRPDGEVYHPDALDLAGFCRSLGEQIESVCRLAGCHFTYDSELTSLITLGDERLLRRLILSLVSNAIKSVGKGGHLGLKLTKVQKRAVLTVWDSGAGPKEGELPHLFGALEDRPLSTNPKEGLGLGLDAVRRIAALHGGNVMVEGRPGEGLRCAVSLPIRTSGKQLSLRSPSADYVGGFSPLMVELSDVLPSHLFLPEDLV